MTTKGAEPVDVQSAGMDQNGSIHVVDRLFLSPAESIMLPRVHYFSIDRKLTYKPYYDDFGPYTLDSVFRFVEIVEEHLQIFPDLAVALRTLSDERKFTNTIFLVSAYLTLKHGLQRALDFVATEEVQKRIITFKDVSVGAQNFHLAVEDCIQGFSKAMLHGWLDSKGSGIDLNDYIHYGNSLNGDLHEVVPGKIVALRGPRDLLNGEVWKDVHDDEGHFMRRDFSPEHYAGILRQFNVQVIIRLNAPQYDRKAFAKVGIAVVDLYFPDCSLPPADVIGKFLAITEGISGAVAVHCQAGLGRTGTLICLYLMKHYGFKAREAISWLRVVRSGSVIGCQQQFLCEKEALMHRCAERQRARSGGGVACPMVSSSASLQELEHFAKAVSAQVDTQIRGVQNHIMELQRCGHIPPPPSSPSTVPDTPRSTCSMSSSSSSVIAVPLSPNISPVDFAARKRSMFQLLHHACWQAARPSSLPLPGKSTAS